MCGAVSAWVTKIYTFQVVNCAWQVEEMDLFSDVTGRSINNRKAVETGHDALNR